MPFPCGKGRGTLPHPMMQSRPIPPFWRRRRLRRWRHVRRGCALPDTPPVPGPPVQRPRSRRREALNESASWLQEKEQVSTARGGNSAYQQARAHPAMCAPIRGAMAAALGRRARTHQDDGGIARRALRRVPHAPKHVADTPASPPFESFLLWHTLPRRRLCWMEWT